MNVQPPDPAPDTGPPPEQQHDSGKRSGQGSNTALQAMIRQRKQAEGPDTPDPAAPDERPA